MVNSHTAVLQSSHQHHQEQEEESEQHLHRQGHHQHQSEFEVSSVQVLCFIGEGGETQNEAMVKGYRGSEGRKMQNLLPRPIGWKTEVLNKTKEQSVEQQDVLMLFLFP
jgi:hypothetical protein